MHKQESGEGRLGCVIWLLVILVLGVVGWKVVPVKIKSAELQDFMVQQANIAGRVSGERIKIHIFDEAMKLGLPVEKKDVSVQKAGGKIRMKCTYTVPLEFPGYTYKWEIEHDVERNVYLF